MAEKKESEISPLAFLNHEFLNSPPARTIRILSEYLERGGTSFAARPDS